MYKRGGFAFWISLTLLVLLIVGIFLYFALFKPGYGSIYEEKVRQGLLKNPVEDLTDEEAVNLFDKDFVYYLMYSIKAYDLHNPPLSKDTPKISVYVDDELFFSEIIKGEINVRENSKGKSDIIIRTTKIEAVKMLRDRNYIQKSFQAGGSSAELVAGKSTLFAKGYLNLYNELTGKSITGNIIRIYAS